MKVLHKGPDMIRDWPKCIHNGADMTRKRLKVYIAGPMRGLPDFNYPTFNFYAERAREAGFAVVNPAEIAAQFGTPEEINGNRALLAAVVAAELHALDTCNAICLLPGWEKSVGAKRELARALQLGLSICVVAITTPDQIVEIMRRAEQ